MNSKIKIIILIIILTLSAKRNLAATLNVKLSVQIVNFTNGPENMGIGLSHTSTNGNWLKFIERLGVNSARRFITSMSNLRNFIGTADWGKDLNGILVINKITYSNAIAALRTKNGRSVSYGWKIPVKWSSILKYMSSDAGIHGTDDYVISKLTEMGISLLAVEGIGCSGTYFEFESMDPTSSVYWSERYELYKQSYAMAVYSYNKGIKMLEFFNEPDLALGTQCLDANKFLDFYKIRSLSIQNAYEDLNNEALPQNRINVQIVASAFARKTYGGDVTRYLGEIVIKNKNYMFGNSDKLTNWTNIHLYSLHLYDKSGETIGQDFEYIKNEIKNDPTVNQNDQIPAIITEHNSRTSSSWDTKTSTSDTNFEASRLASQIANLIKAKITSHYVFKFSVTESFSPNRDIAKNGIHWGDIYSAPYDISDSTLSAEAMRLLTYMKNSKVFLVTNNDTSSYRTYLSSSKGNDGFYYLYIVNDADDTVNLSLDFSKWAIVKDTKIFFESASRGFFGEVKDVLSAPSFNNLLTFSIDPYSTNRLAFQTGTQTTNTIMADLSCTAKAGFQSNISFCSSPFLNAGTSNTIKHETTAVALIRFKSNSQFVSNGQRTLLKINVEEIVGNTGNNDMTLQILGIRNVNAIWNETTASWNSLTSGIKILKPLSTGLLIDSINKNIINWSSSSDICIVGHVTANNGSKNKVKMIDVSEYVNNVVNSSGKYFTFIFYRPFRFPSYKTAAGVLPSDDLSNGSLLKITSATSSLNSPQLIQYKSF